MTEVDGMRRGYSGDERRRERESERGKSAAGLFPQCRALSVALSVEAQQV
jgi:hypothetical protein